MEAKRRHFGAGVTIGVIGTLLALFVIVLVVARTGGYNVAASRGHAAGAFWLLDTTMQSSVRSRAAENAMPARLGEADVAAGAGVYRTMCEHCHGGVDVEPAEWSRGMSPRPPHLVERASRWTQAEVLWIARHGIKYTGMPSFGGTHDEETLWNVAGFVKRLPAMTPEQYRAYAPDGHGGEAAAETSGGTQEHGAGPAAGRH